MGIITAILPVILQIVGYFLTKNKQNTEMQELFYKWVEKIQDDYMMSAEMRDKAKARLQSILEKPLIEAP